MAIAGVKIQLDGLPQLVSALRNNASAADPLRQALHAIGLQLSSDSRRAAPVNLGKLRGSIAYEVDRSPLPTYVRVGTIGSNAPSYAAYMEFGTGLVHDHPSWPRKRHIPPAAALEGWVSQKGRSRGESSAARRSRLGRVQDDARTVANAIARRGGLEPRRYLRGPFERNQAQYVRILRDAIGRLRLDG